MVATAERPTTPPRRNLLRDARVRGLIIQAVVLLAAIAAVGMIVDNTARNLNRLGIAPGFAFLNRTAGFDIGIRLIPYEMASSYGRAFLVGLVNTLVVSGCGIVLATIIGFFVGVMRLSSNWLVAKLAEGYVELGRNTPLLLQIVFWYVFVIQALPNLRQSISIFDIAFLNNRGLYSPQPIFHPGFGIVLIALVVGLFAAYLLRRWAARRQELTGQPFPTVWAGLGVVIAVVLLAAAATGFPLSWNYPELKGLNFTGGLVMLPEFVALLLALTLYTAAYIAEIVRSGIQSVSRGQSEAAFALGLRPGVTMRRIILPQALRVIIPPLTSEYLNLTKNSSLAVAIGYPDLVSVFTGTVLNQTGQAVEVIFITMLVYGAISLVISLFMNLYNRRIALVER